MIIQHYTCWEWFKDGYPTYIEEFNKDHQKNEKHGLEKWLIKSTYYSYIGPEFSSQHPDGMVHLKASRSERTLPMTES